MGGASSLDYCPVIFYIDNLSKLYYDKSLKLFIKIWPNYEVNALNIFLCLVCLPYCEAETQPEALKSGTTLERGT